MTGNYISVSENPCEIQLARKSQQHSQRLDPILIQCIPFPQDVVVHQNYELIISKALRLEIRLSQT